MGGIRRIKKKMTQPVAMADTKIAFNNCKVFLVSPNPAAAQKAGKEFAGFMEYLNDRARGVNIRDLYEAHFGVLEKIKSGEPILN